MVTSANIVAAAKLQNSFDALVRLFDRPHAARRSVAVLIAIHTLLLVYSAYVHSPTIDEPAHLAAGLSHWKFGRFELYRVNPPLVRMMAALPVMAVGYEEDWDEFYDASDARPEFNVGRDFVKTNCARSPFLFMLARWACIPLSWIGAIVCYFWASDMYGRSSGVLACAIWCFEPNILAHASLMTPDAGASAIGLAACYAFWRWLRSPTWRRAAVMGLVLGVAELTKTTLILFYPLWPLMWLLHHWPNRYTITLRELKREAGMLCTGMIIGLYTLNLGYGFEGSMTKLKDFDFTSRLFTGRQHNFPALQRGLASSHSVAQPNRQYLTFHNRFAGGWLCEFPVPFPKNYIIGIDIQQGDFEDPDRASYLRGLWQDHGWWYYYIYAAAIKVPLGLLLLIILRASVQLLPILSRGSFGANNYQSLKANTEQSATSLGDEFFLLFPALITFTVVSSQTGFNENMRYVLPAFPFIFVWVSGNVKYYLTSTMSQQYFASKPQRRMVRMLLASANLVAFCWIITSTLFIFPHSLSYFNESIGGPLNGPKHLLGSNVDWGQDLWLLKQWMQKNMVESREVRIVLPYSARLIVAGQSSENLDPKWEIMSCNRVFESGSPWRDRSSSQLTSRIGYTNWVIPVE